MRLRQGATAPSSKVRLGSAMSVDSSMSRTTPVPPQVGHAPPLLKARSIGGGAVEFHAAGGTGDGQLGRHVQGRCVHVPVGAHVAAEAREHEAQVVQKLRGGAEGGMHAGNAGPLAQGEGRRHVQHLVYGSASGLGNAPAGVGGKRLQVAAAALGVQNAQRKRAFARAGDARNAHELPQRHVQAEVLQVVYPRPAHLDAFRFGEGGGRGRRRVARRNHGRGSEIDHNGSWEEVRCLPASVALCRREKAATSFHFPERRICVSSDRRSEPFCGRLAPCRVASWSSSRALCVLLRPCGGPSSTFRALCVRPESCALSHGYHTVWRSLASEEERWKISFSPFSIEHFPAIALTVRHTPNRGLTKTV